MDVSQQQSCYTVNPVVNVVFSFWWIQCSATLSAGLQQHKKLAPECKSVYTYTASFNEKLLLPKEELGKAVEQNSVLNNTVVLHTDASFLSFFLFFFFFLPLSCHKQFAQLPVIRSCFGVVLGVVYAHKGGCYQCSTVVIRGITVHCRVKYQETVTIPSFLSFLR